MKKLPMAAWILIAMVIGILVGWMIFAMKSASLAGLEVPANTVKRCRL